MGDKKVGLANERPKIQPDVARRVGVLAVGVDVGDVGERGVDLDMRAEEDLDARVAFADVRDERADCRAERKTR